MRAKHPRPIQLTLPLEGLTPPETAQETRERVWRGQQTEAHLQAEARDFIGRVWADRTATGVMQMLSRSDLLPRKEQVAAAIHGAGSLQEIILFLDELGHGRCSCRREWEERQDAAWGVEWVESPGSHEAACWPRRARDLLAVLKGEDR